jgi:signal transduction histidine kinase/CheY-like chemotaxis protein
MSSQHCPASSGNRSIDELIEELNSIKDQYSAKEQMCRELLEELARIKLMHGENQSASELKIPKDGRSIPGTGTNIRLTDDTMIGIGLDLSERNQAEQALKDSENNFRTALRNSKFVPSQFDRELRYQWIYNCHPDFSSVTIIGKRDDELEDSEGSKLLMALKQTVIEKGTGMRDEISFSRRDGTRTYDFLIEPLRDTSGEIVGGTSAAFDITEIKQTESELEQILSRMQWVLDQVGIGTWFNLLPFGRLNWDKQTKILFFVPPDEEPVIELFWSRLHPDDREPTRVAVEKAIHDRTTYAMEHRAVNPKTGKIRWIRSAGRATYAEDGNPIRFDGINYDITEQKQTEKALRESEETLLRVNEYLEQQVAERTALAEKRAKQLQVLAVELIKAEEKERERIALLLHEDLQQLLAIAKMQLQAARKILPPDNFLFNVENLIAECIHKSRNLSHELNPPILHHPEFGSSLKWLIEKMNVQFGLEVEFRHDEVEMVEREPLKIFIFRAIQELLFNIVKHSEVKKAKIDLCSSDDLLVISVSDQGKGFDPESLMDDKPTIKIGLVSLRERVSHIGGTFLIESSPGQGCRITLTLPDSKSVEKLSDDQPAVLSKNILDSEKMKEKKIKVLLVDDHKILREGLVRLISNQMDIQVVGEASGGIQAIELARQLNPDLILMDISMPDMDGIKATRIIKREMPQIRIIGLSMFEDEVTPTMLDSGAAGFISKTASTSELLRTIYTVAKKVEDNND